MINMKYEIWRDTCTAFLDTENTFASKYLQLFPFTLLTPLEKERIISENFFEIYIKGGGIFADSKLFDTPNRYLQKANGSFRITKLVSPILYLYLLAIGTQVSKDYKKDRRNTRVYHSGNVSELSYHYKDSYDAYYSDINESQEIYNYFVKIDLTNFYDSLDINNLFKKINKDEEILDPRTTLIYKNILSMIGNEKYPIVENNAGLSYLATEVYLDETDTAIEKSLPNIEYLGNFQLVRYVDDLFIFYNCEEDYVSEVITEIKNELINIYSKSGLIMNESKFKSDKTENIQDSLRTILYDFYVNGVKVDFSDFYDSEDLAGFFRKLTSISKNHSHELFQKAQKESFEKKEVMYSDEEVFRHFLYKQSAMFENEEIKSEIKLLVDFDYKIFKYSIVNMITAVCNTSDGEIIKSLLSQIFKKYHSRCNDIFDEVIVISYLTNRNFVHADLREILSVLNENLLNFIETNCKKSFFENFEDSIKYNNLYDSNSDQYKLLITDEIIWFQFFMFKYTEKIGRQLESHSYLKVFFDRLIAHIMNCTGIETCGKRNKPNINKYHAHNVVKKDLKKLGITVVNYEPIEDIIQKAHDLRNSNPVNHASSEMLKDDQISLHDLFENKLNLLKIIDTCLDHCLKE